MQAKVTVYPRREILDPQGKAIRTALQRVGFAEVTEVRAGKSFEIDLGPLDPQAAADRVAAMCEQLLANTVVEEYAIEIVSEAPAGAKPSIAAGGTA
jgi:phosphoribosylformylglycinamidine synthase PurS subunit